MYILIFLIALTLTIVPLILGWVGINSFIKIIINKNKLNSNDLFLYILNWLIAIAFIIFVTWIILQGKPNCEFNFLCFLQASMLGILINAIQNLFDIDLFPFDVGIEFASIFMFLIQLGFGWLGINTFNKIVDAKQKDQSVYLIRWIILILFISYILFAAFYLASWMSLSH